MCSFKCSVFIVLLVISFCFAQDEARGAEVARKRIKHKLHHLHHNPYFYYLAFLAIKLKFAFVVGTMIMLALFASKTYALLKYGILTQKSKEPEKIYIQAPQHNHPTYYDDHQDFSSGDFTGSAPYERGFQSEIYDNYNLIQDLIKKVDLNEVAFNSLGMTETECKQRFVCEADLRANNDTILNLEMFLIRDNSFLRYRTKDPIKSLEDCAKLCTYTI